jgi:type II secretory pathway pseudopilin PulG
MMQRVFHRRNDERSTTSAGFTMVELMVVIAMTLILTALLLPALSDAKEKSRRAVCRNNEKQLSYVFQMYADDNNDILPSAADNIGNYHSIVLSDATFTNLVNNYAEGTSTIFYCPNLVFNAGANGLVTHSNYGYIIGYSYLADNVPSSTKGADTGSATVIKMSAQLQTNVLLADANYWMPNGNGYGQSMRLAPHTASGAALAHVTSAPGATNSASLGAVGGNVELYNNSITWRNLSSMQTYSVSSGNDAWANY